MLGVFCGDITHRVHRPDWRVRLAFDVFYLAVLAAGAVAVGWHSFLADTWPADVYGLVAAVCAWSAVLALGRALVRGPRRRLFWVYPPAVDAD